MQRPFSKSYGDKQFMHDELQAILKCIRHKTSEQEVQVISYQPVHLFLSGDSFDASKT